MRRTSLTALAVGLAFMGLGLVACNEVPLELQTAELLDHASPVDRTSDGEVVQSVTGNGHMVDAMVDRTVTINILKFADGTVEGWYHALGRGPAGASIRVRIDCLHVVGNQAWAGGTVVAAVDPDNIGRPYSFRFIDNGEGANAPPDEIGAARFEYYDCETEPDIELRPLTAGNLQVRGG